jgi:hypothetical protein
MAHIDFSAASTMLCPALAGTYIVQHRQPLPCPWGHVNEFMPAALIKK